MYQKLLSEIYNLNEDLVRFIKKNELNSLFFTYREIDDLIVKCLEYTSTMDESNFADDIKNTLEFSEFIEYFDKLIVLRKSKLIMNMFIS